MAPQSPALPTLPFTYATWKKDTNLTVSITDPTGKAKFAVLDKAVEAYTAKPSQASLTAMRNALLDWTSYKDKSGGAGAWKKSDRNKKLTITALYNAIQGAGDTDKGFGIPDFMSEGMVNARLGILYLFGNLACDEGKYRIITNGLIDMAGKGSGTLGTAVKRTTDAGTCFTPYAAGSAERTAKRQQVSNALKGIAASVTQAIFTQRANGEDDGEGTKTEAIWKAIPGGLQTVCDHIAEKVMDQISPFLANGVAATQGLVTAVKVGGERFVVHARGKGVTLVPGVPTTTIDGIKRGMDLSLAGEVYNVLKGGTALALEGLTAGVAGAIAGIAFSAIEVLVAFARKVHDFYRIRLFLTDAKALWAQREKPNSLHRQPYAFNRWYRKTAMRVPAIPVLTLNSGVCGDKMRMLCMFSNEGEVISQQNFDKGVAYIDHLKGWGSSYLEETAYSFTSADKLVAELIKPAKV
ncbi:hypothetical protein [Luteibacter aegosomatissinici]|uniref:hypothetical protein n=1 Tax=Luteibacter aegosomatissinici TaxID=2911539 RepID=UPI001FF86B98|nr:hypothetical protein [Luteibacter aegosomatissinici]UPG95699.1 hypothetical protein L2Y97_06195 [Luteibacter aegosomatissinici]